MTFFATITKQRQLNIPAEAMKHAPGFTAPGQVRIEFQDGNMVIKPVKDFMEMRGALSNYATKFKNMSLQEIIKMEEEAVADAYVERYLRSLPKKKNL